MKIADSYDSFSREEEQEVGGGSRIERGKRISISSSK